MAFNFSPKIVTNGLVLYLDAANERSYNGFGTTWYDLSPSKNDVTLVNGVQFNDVNNYFTFNGTNQYATLSCNLTLLISRPTIIIACTTPTSLSSVIVSKGQNGTYIDYGIFRASSTGFDSMHSSCYNGVTGLPPVTNPINIYAVAYTGTAVNYYRNGINVGTDASCYTPSYTPGGVLSIGAFLSGDGISYGNFFTGNIATVQIYNRQLSSAEIIQNQNALKSRFN